MADEVRMSVNESVLDRSGLAVHVYFRIMIELMLSAVEWTKCDQWFLVAIRTIVKTIHQRNK